MKIPGITSSLLCLLSLCASALVIAAETSSQEIEKLVCGAAEVTVHAQCLEFAEQERQCKTQTLHLFNADIGIAKTLGHEGRPIKQAFVPDGTVLDAVATGWACVQSGTATKYIYVMYTCIEHEKRPECAGSDKEWEALYGLDGKKFTDRLPRRGKARNRELVRIYKKLGLNKVMDQPVQLQGIKY